MHKLTLIILVLLITFSSSWSQEELEGQPQGIEQDQIVEQEFGGQRLQERRENRQARRQERRQDRREIRREKRQERRQDRRQDRRESRRENRKQRRAGS